MKITIYISSTLLFLINSISAGGIISYLSAEPVEDSSKEAFATMPESTTNTIGPNPENNNKV